MDEKSNEQDFGRHKQEAGSRKIEQNAQYKEEKLLKNSFNKKKTPICIHVFCHHSLISYSDTQEAQCLSKKCQNTKRV